MKNFLRRTSSLGLVLVLLLTAITIIRPHSVSAFDGGEGTVESPYKISTCVQLQAMGADETSRAAHYELVNNIDCGDPAGDNDTSVWNGGAGFMPVGSCWGPGFAGSFNGNGYSISDLYINRPTVDWQSLFGCTNAGAVIQKVGMVNVNITGQRYAGGIVGVLSGAGTILKNSYATGNITLVYGDTVGSGQYAGGLVSGLESGSLVEDSYSTVAVDTYYPLEGYGEGGIAGYKYSSTVTNTFWDTEVSGNPRSDGGTGKTTSEMKSQSTFTDAGWDFSGIWGIDNGINSGYPYLRNVEQGGFASGSGSAENPYQITNCTQLQNIGNDEETLVANYILTGNVDCSETETWNEGDGFMPIGFETAFKGDFDGAGNSIQNLTINRGISNNVALFASLTGATVHDFSISGSIVGSERVGAVAGTINYDGGANEVSVVNNISSSAEVQGNESFVGGIVGLSEGGESNFNLVNDNSTSGVVYGNSAVGGIVGSASYTDISRNYSSGYIAADWSDAGGIIGAAARSEISENYTRSDINVGHVNAGGLVGGTYQASLFDNVARGNVNSENIKAGGLVGLIVNSEIARSYATGDVTALNNVGGLIGTFQYVEETGHSVVTDSFSTGSAYASEEPADTINGFVGNLEPDTWDDSNFTNNHFNRTNNNECAVVNGFAAVEYEECLGVYLDQEPLRFQSATESPYTVNDVAVWDFDAVWKTQSGDYPCLLNVDESCSTVVPHDVADVVSAENGSIVTIEESGCSNVESFTSQKETSLTTKDVGFDYTAGLVNFTLTGCPEGGTATVALTFFGTYDASKVVVRKFNAVTNTFTTLSGIYEDMSVSSTTVEGQPAYRIVYNINDGSSLDQDGVANGTIVDPIGVAVSTVAVPNTGLGIPQN